MGKAASTLITLSVLLITTGAARANNAPTVSSMPTLSSSTVVADDTAEYTVTMTATDADGYNDIRDLRDLRVLFNLVEEVESPAGQGRGYFAWGQTDGDVTYYNDGTWITADATGGGRWGYLSSGWGGTTYMTPIDCATSVSGSATGSNGSRTVTWTFRAKPAWADNPLVNDADAYTRDNATVSGWQENPEEFDVVGSSCTTYSTVPQAPIVSSVTDTSADVAINPIDSSTDLFAIRVSDGNDAKYVQADGTLGLWAIFRTRAQWGTITVTGLESNTSYDFAARSYSNTAGICPSAFGSATGVITEAVIEHTIDLSATGKTISRGVYGSPTRLDYFPDYVPIWNKVWDILPNTTVRGLEGGTYNWKDLSGQAVGHSGDPGPEIPTTLDWMRLVRDHNSMPLVQIDLRGIGPLESSGWCTFYFSDTSLETVRQLAADWVRYTNFILPTYRQGDTLSPSDQAILDSIEWNGKPTLLAPDEASTPKATYFEIDNEPEIAQPICTPGVELVKPSPSEYTSRYKEITTAMLAVDPTIKVGPCITVATDGNNEYLSALLSDPNAQVDFISYHPYGPLYYKAQMYGDTEATAEMGLQTIRQWQTDARDGIRSAITASGRNPDAIELFASEWNASHWRWEGSYQTRRVSHALGVAETIWTFSDLGLSGACYWSFPVCSDGTEPPGYKVFEAFHQYYGTTLIDKFTDEPKLHFYLTRNEANDKAFVWIMNFSKDSDKTLSLSFPEHIMESIQVVRLANVNGETHLFDRNDPPVTEDPLVDWVAQSPPQQQGTNYQLTLPHSTVTVIEFQYRRAANGDFDLDDDVDLEDFGVMQRCLSGSSVAQNDPECQPADFNGDTDVDNEDLNTFINCFSGANVLPPSGCFD